MIAVESASVPSQSKTTKRYRRGPRSIGSGTRESIEARDVRSELRRKRRLDGHFAAIHRMRKADPARVQEHPLQPVARERLVPCEIAVLVVARERESDVCEMNADLMRATGLELRLQQRLGGLPFRPDFRAPHDRARKPAGGVDPDPPLALA